MTDPPESPGPDRPKPVHQAPKPARPSPKPARVAPTSARSMAGEPEPEREEAANEERVFTVAGESWVARTLGLVGGGSTHRAPLMLVGFWPAQRAEGPPEREALVVGTSLEALPVNALPTSFERSRPFQTRPARESSEPARSPRAGKNRRGRGGRGDAGRSRRP